MRTYVEQYALVLESEVYHFFCHYCHHLTSGQKPSLLVQLHLATCEMAVPYIQEAVSEMKAHLVLIDTQSLHKQQLDRST
jgi:hypothetical protein